MTVLTPPGVYGGVSVPAIGIGATVTTANSTDVVVLRGLTFTGGGTATRAIDFYSGRGVLHVESCLISGFQNHGILIRPGAPTDETSIKDTNIRNSGVAIGVGTGSRVSIDNCRLENSNTAGLYSTNNGAHVAIRNSVVAGNTNGIWVTIFNQGIDSMIDIENCIVLHSDSAALVASGNIMNGSGIINVSNTMIAFNATGLSVGSSGKINSFGNNKLTDNITPGSFTTIIGQQ